MKLVVNKDYFQPESLSAFLTLSFLTNMIL